MNNDTIFALAKKHHDYAIECRRYFRRYPEVSGNEYNTQKKIIAELEALGLECRKAAKTGVIAELRGAKSGRTIALRADIDALPLADECGAPYQSQNAGICHACGHDGHMAVLLGTIRTLADLKNEIAGTFRFIFQPSEEEFPSGAAAMIAEGALVDVAAVIGAHIWQPLPLGTVGIAYGNLMAAPDKFTITIRGKGGHGSMPHQTVDPILIAAETVVALHTIVSRSMDPLGLAVLSVGSIHAGNAFNVIPDTAVIEGTVRSFDDEVRSTIFARIKEVSEGIAAANRAECTIDTIFGPPAICNHAAEAKIVAEAVGRCQSGIAAKEVLPVMCGEDFAYYVRTVPGAYFLLGTGTKTVSYPHHHAKFDIDETCLLHGIELMTRAAIRLAFNTPNQ